MSISTPYTKRIELFLQNYEQYKLPLRFYVRVDDAFNIISLDEPWDKGIRIVSIIEYLDWLLTQGLQYMTPQNMGAISNISKISIEDVVMSALLVLDEQAYQDNVGRDLLLAIDSQAAFNRDEVKRRKADWVSRYQDDATNDQRNYANIPAVVTYLDRLPAHFQLTDNVITSEEVIYNFVTDKDNIEIFDQAVASLDIPFISTTNMGKTYYKIYNAESVSDKYYRNIISLIRNAPPEGTISFLLWKGTGDPLSPPRESFTMGAITNNKVVMEYAVKGQTNYNLERKIGTCFRLQLQPPVKGNINVRFDVPNLVVNKYLFQLMIELDATIHENIIMVESTNPGTMEGGHIYQFLIMGGPLPLPKQTPRVSIVSGEDFTSIGFAYAKNYNIDYYRLLIAKLLTHYMMNYEQYKNMFNNLPWIHTTAFKKTVKRIKGTEPASNIGKLKAAAPDAFIEDYSRRCQAKDQPTVVKQEQVSALMAETIEHKGRIYNRDVMTFPVKNGNIYLTCFHEHKPFVGLQRNKLSNKNTYPYLPCCYATQQRDSKTGQYIRKASDSKSKERIKTNKASKRGRAANLPYRIVQFLNDVYPADYVRVGTVISKDSFIHNLLYALGEVQFNGYYDAMEREDFETCYTMSREWRRYLANLDLTCCSQELYDYSPSQMRDILLKDDQLVDPALIYRIIEVYLGYNIFVFTGSVDKDVRTRLSGDVDIPRYRLFHARTYRPGHPVIMFYKNWGAEADSLDDPQFEVIGIYHNEDSIRTVFTGELADKFNEALYKLVMETHKTTVNIGNGELIHPFSLPEYETRLSSITGQYIDSYGKMRALRLTSNNRNVYVITVPSQPIWVPRIDRIEHNKVADVKMMLGVPSAKTNKGLYYDIGVVKHAIYVPVVDTSNLETVNVRTTSANIDVKHLVSLDIGSKGVNTSDRLIKLSTISVALLQIMEWLYMTFDPNLEYNLNEFNRYLHVTSDNLDTLEVYNIANIPYVLPTANTIEYAITYLKSKMPKAITRDNKFLIVSEDMYVSIMYFLNNFISYSRQRSNVGTVYERYAGKDSFIPHPNNIIFDDLKTAEIWMKSATNVDLTLEFKDSIIAWNRTTDEPIIYLDSELGKFLIQNVSSASLGAALYVCQQWEQHKINVGITEQRLTADVHYNVYKLDMRHKLYKYREVNTQISGTTYYVYEFDINQFAAMLPLF